MRLVRLLGGLALFMAIGALGFIAPGAHAAVSYNVGVCDPKAPLNCVKPAADGSIAVTGGGGGGSLSATASATPTPVTAGTNKPLNIGLSSNLFATLVDSLGNFIDFSTPSAVTQSGTWTFGLNSVTTGGTTPYGLQTAASTNSTNVKNAAGVLYGMNLENTTTTVYYLRMYDAAAAPTCSSSTGFVRSWPIPPASTSGLVGGIAVSLPSTGTQFSNGISFCVTGGPTSTDNTNAATGVFINLDYK